MFHAEGSHGPAPCPPATPSALRARGEVSGPKALVGAWSVANFGKGDENQDAFCTSCSESGTKCFVGVFDGHGNHGKTMSHFAKQALSKSLFSNIDIHTEPVDAIQAAFRDTQEKIEKEHRHHAELSGTTAITAYQHRNRLVVANVGDSRAVLGRCSTPARQTVSAVELSIDQKPARPDERQRIIAAGGTVDQMAIPVVQRGGVRWIRAGPERVMDKQGMGGLAMSRALGDLRLHPYVISQPEVVERKLDSRDKVLVLASDGVWDHISSQEAVDIAGKFDDPKAAAREITGIARHRWQIATEGQMSDDITAVVVRLNAVGEPSISASSSAPVTALKDPAQMRRTSVLTSLFGGPPQRRGGRIEAGRQDVRKPASPAFALPSHPNGLRLPECPRVSGKTRSITASGRRSDAPVSTGLRPVSTGGPTQRLVLDTLPPPGHRNGLL
ncbi:unnamed protein product [Durusdinium trenchii]|uniref:PPM-type phosphatase domain-containing protein n=1 Tax=Durusdinium trenchii TaxID=1381693 RepID=A0ABP0RBA3_9DINO